MDEHLFKEIAERVEREYQMSGLSDGLYYDFAKECARRYLETEQEVQADGLTQCPNCLLGGAWNLNGRCAQCGHIAAA